MANSGTDPFDASADAYDRHIGRYGPSLAAALIDAAGIAAGRRVLDVGCGPGALTAALAELLGAEAVAAVDPSEPFAAACAQRLPGVEVQVASSEALPFGDDTFDAALSQLALNFMSDAPAALAEMCRVVRPGGIVAAAVWDYSGEMTLLRQFWDAAAAVDPAARELDEGRSMPYATQDELTQLWRAADLEDVAVESLTAKADYANFDDLWTPFEAGAGPSGAYVAALEPRAREGLREELQVRLSQGDEPFALFARAWCATGRVARQRQ